MSRARGVRRPELGTRRARESRTRPPHAACRLQPALPDPSPDVPARLHDLSISTSRSSCALGRRPSGRTLGGALAPSRRRCLRRRRRPRRRRRSRLCLRSKARVPRPPRSWRAMRRASESVTFDDAVARALARNPTIGRGDPGGAEVSCAHGAGARELLRRRSSGRPTTRASITTACRTGIVFVRRRVAQLE